MQRRVEDGGADRHGQRDLPLAEADRSRERRSQGVEPGGQIHARGGIGEDDHPELVACEAGQRVARLEAAGQPAGDREKR